MSETILFFGSGPVAARSLELLNDNFEIEAVITKPKPLHHKGTFPVLGVAQTLGLPVLAVTNKKELDALILTKPLNSRLGVLIDFGIIVSQMVIDHFPLGIINSHFSLLPEWRGADPITFAILSGQKKTGVSLMFLVEEMDEGPLAAVGEQEITSDTTTPELTTQLISLSNALLTHEVPRILSGEAKGISQEQMGNLIPGYPTKPTYSRKLSKDDGPLEFTKPAEQLEREVRAYLDWPKSRTTIGDSEVIVTKAHVASGHGIPGSIWKQGKELGIYTIHNIFVIDSLKPIGRQEMSAAAFLVGHKV